MSNNGTCETDMLLRIDGAEFRESIDVEERTGLGDVQYKALPTCERARTGGVYGFASELAAEGEGSARGRASHAECTEVGGPHGAHWILWHTHVLCVGRVFVGRDGANHVLYRVHGRVGQLVLFDHYKEGACCCTTCFACFSQIVLLWTLSTSELLCFLCFFVLLLLLLLVVVVVVFVGPNL